MSNMQIGNQGASAINFNQQEVSTANQSQAAQTAPAPAPVRGSAPNNPLAAMAAMGPATSTGSSADVATAMQAFDHVADLLRQAGGDATISRDEAKKLVHDLFKGGRGTAMLASDEIFKMIDAFDSARGARVTGYDLKQARPLVEMWLSGGDGATTAAGQALLELGKILDLPKRPGRVGYDVPEQGMQHIANLVRDAANGDGISSRADMKAFVAGLRAEGRGNEALGAEMFFRFMDHRDAGAGNRITDADIQKAVGYSREHLLQNKDANHNGYSKAEIENFSTTANAFLNVGHMIDGGIIQ